MIKQIYPDKDSKLIWLDWNDYTPEELDNLVLACFDVLNIPRFIDYDFKNYYITWFSNEKSSTGYAAILLNKDKKVYKANIGYENE